MPSTQNNDRDIQQYPEIIAYFNSEPPNTKLLEHAQSPQEVKYAVSSESRKISLFTLCCYYGKLSHLRALQFSENEHQKISWFIRLWHYAKLQTPPSLPFSQNELILREIKINNYQAIRLAAKNGHTSIIDYLEKFLNAEERVAAVQEGSYSAIRWAARHGYIDTIRYLIAHLSVAEQKVAVNLAIQWAVVKGHTATIRFLFSQLSNDGIIKQIKKNNFFIIQLASENGRTDTIIYILSHLSPEQKKQAVKINSYAAIRKSAKNNHTDTIGYLETHLSADEKKKAVTAMDHEAVKLAAKNNRNSTVLHFLNIDVGFAYAERHDQEYGQQYVYPFVQYKLNMLKTEKEVYEQSHPNGVFDVPKRQADLCFYMLRNLIRRGVARDFAPAEDTQAQSAFLLSIPSIEELAHCSLNDGQDNELLRLALRLGNQQACAQLMALPEVARLAEQHNHYLDDSDLDLRVLARDRESSMTALSKTERENLLMVEQHYQQKMTKAGGEEQVFEALKVCLKNYYEQYPATIDDSQDSETLPLPFEWSELQVLRQQLTNEQYQQALQAYYRHEAHSAYRYLSKPNYWMHPSASYVYVYYNEQGQQTAFRYSTFKKYIALISLLYLAVIDKDMPAIKGHTLEGRVELFIKQLALIGRAHNWDSSRQVTKDGQCIQEEYDDTQADKPSCYSGVNRRLLQSVLGHGLFQRLSTEIVKQAINEQLMSYFQQAITNENAGALNAAFDSMISLESDMKVHQETLCSINISEPQQQSIIKSACAQLEMHYPGQVDKYNAVMQRHLNSGIKDGPDVLRFDGLLGLQSIIRQRISEKKTKNASIGSLGMFEGKKEENMTSTSTGVGYKTTR